MKVLHLNSTDIQGGAARGAYWLHQALRQRGVDSRMLVDRKYSDDPQVVAPTHGLQLWARKLRAYLDELPLRRYQKTDDAYWTVGWVPNDIVGRIRRIDPDIVHLHWTGNGFLPIQALAHLPYPLVWTLRDMWGFTGGCHYTADCARYEAACGACPQLRSDREEDLSRHIWRRKLRHWRNLDLWLVPISSWLADCARTSSLFGGRPIEVIPNGVDARRFQPTDKATAKQMFGFAPDSQIILFGAINATTDPRKGFAHFQQALSQLGQTKLAGRAEVAVFGDTAPGSLGDAGMKTHYLGHFDDDQRLALLYSSADVMVTPSLQEAFGKTLIEAMACGTPVVAFNSGGPVDIIEHRADGYLARPFCAEDLAEGIAWCLAERARPLELGQRGRAKVEREFDINVVAHRYLALYQQILDAA